MVAIFRIGLKPGYSACRGLAGALGRAELRPKRQCKHRNSRRLIQPMSRPRVASVPTWTWIAPILGSSLLALTFAQVVPAAATLVLLLDAIALGASVFAAVHHAEV